MFLKNASILYGKELKYVDNVQIQIKNGNFRKIGKNIKLGKDSIDCKGLLVVPGFVNLHTHIGDSIAKDITLNRSVDEKIHPVMGIKSRVLKNTKKSHLESFMRNTCISMLKKGITTFVDFREGGIDGAIMLRNVLREVPIRGIILGRVDYYQNRNEIQKNTPFPLEKRNELKKLLKMVDGVGISGANENSDSSLKTYSKVSKIRAIHSSETEESISVSKTITGKSETKRAIQCKPHFLVHMTNASTDDLKLAAKNTRGIVVCPRANSSLAEGIPNIKTMQEVGCILGLGTDNVMINSADMFREMDFLWKVTMGNTLSRVLPINILKMATSNASVILGRKIGQIRSGFVADCIFIDKHSIDIDPMHEVYASLVHRCSEGSIKAVMVNGEFVHGKL